MIKRSISMIIALAMMLSLNVYAVKENDVKIYIGNIYVDYMAYEILKEIDVENKTDIEKIRAVYDWIILNCDRYEWDGTYNFEGQEVVENAEGWFKEYYEQGIANGEIVNRINMYEISDKMTSDDSNAYITSYANSIMQTGTGNCAHYSALFAVLLGHLGFESRLIGGYFKNSDGSVVIHKWNYVYVDGEYKWFDVRIDHASYVRTGKLHYDYFNEPNTDIWEGRHVWERDYSDYIYSVADEINQTYLNEALPKKNPYGKTSDWAKDIIKNATEANMIPQMLVGCDFTQGISRLEFAQIVMDIYTSQGGQAFNGSNPFTDTQDEQVINAYNLGIVTGVTQTNFNPHDTLTREQAVTMLGRACELLNNGEINSGIDLVAEILEFDEFYDRDTINEYALNYVKYLSSKGIVNGTGEGMFSPKEQITREQAIKIMLEMM